MNSWSMYMYTYSSWFFACFRSYLFVCALFSKRLRYLVSTFDTQEGRPEPVVEVWARFEHCSSRGVRSKKKLRRKWIRRFPGISAWGFTSFSYIRTILRVFCTEHSGRQLSNALCWEHRRQTETTAAAVQRACYHQPATMIHHVLYTNCSQLLLPDPWIRHRG